jgi:hypothetical protein
LRYPRELPRQFVIQFRISDYHVMVELRSVIRCNVMKLSRLLGMSAALMIAQSALADSPAITPQSLGTVEAVLKFCAKMDHAAAGKYQERLKLIAQVESPTALAAARNTDEYKEAYASALDSVGKLDTDRVSQACSQYLAGSGK